MDVELAEGDGVGVRGLAHVGGIARRKQMLAGLEGEQAEQQLQAIQTAIEAQLELAEVEQARHLGRGKAAGQPVRKDDDPEVFKTRLEAYNRDTAVVAPYYERAGKLTKIDGMQSVDAVSASIAKVLG